MSIADTLRRIDIEREYYKEVADELQAENKRLRGALTRIKEVADMNNYYSIGHLAFDAQNNGNKSSSEVEE